MVGGGGYILAVGRWCWIVVDIFWLVVGGGGYILADGRGRGGGYISAGGG